MLPFIILCLAPHWKEGGDFLGASAWGVEGTDPTRRGTKQVMALVSLPEKASL